jgi:N6-L-threonylcarbamoyladenine synthase
LYQILPITQIIVEVASFDIQKIKNPEIQGIECQNGEKKGFWNAREYALWRTATRARGKKAAKTRSLKPTTLCHGRKGSDAPSSLVTLCKKCHSAFHKGSLKLKLTPGKSYSDAAHVGIMRWELLRRLKEIHSNVSCTYCYITKSVRIRGKLAKCHAVDARCISGSPKAEPLGCCYFPDKPGLRRKAVRAKNTDEPVL